MLPIVACILALQTPIEQPPRLRTILTNGATVLIERMPSEPAITMSLWVSAGSSPETPERHGYRHLLEHLVARGEKRDIDTRLETAGGFLTATTLRDATQFQVVVPRSDLSLGLRALREMTTLGTVTADDITQEAKIMEQEKAVQDTPSLLSVAAWSAAYGDSALDPFGNIDVMRAATPDAIRRLHRSLFVGSGMAIVIAGDVDLDEATRKAAEVLSVLPKGDTKTVFRPEGHGGEASAPSGEARAIAVPGLREVPTAAALMAGLALSSTLGGCFFTYTPSAGPGLMIVGRTDGASLAEAIKKAKAASLTSLGRSLALRWTDRSLSDPRSLCFVRGLLLCQGPGLTPETLRENIAQVTPGMFEEAVSKFQGPESVAVNGR